VIRHAGIGSGNAIENVIKGNLSGIRIAVPTRSDQPLGFMQHLSHRRGPRFVVRAWDRRSRGTSSEFYQEKQIRKDFAKAGKLPKILIVTEKLLTGYHAPVLYAMYLDQPMRDHTLLQAIARVNRP